MEYDVIHSEAGTFREQEGYPGSVVHIRLYLRCYVFRTKGRGRRFSRDGAFPCSIRRVRSDNRHRDVVEVVPQEDHRLFVRFKDGLAGNVGLRPEELAGAVAPLADPEFFRQAH